MKPKRRKRLRSFFHEGHQQGFNRNVETYRLLEVLDELFKKEKINSYADFCRIVSFSPQSFNQIKKGKRNAPVELISATCNILHGNPLYIFLGQEPKVTNVELLESKIEKGKAPGKTEREFLKSIEKDLSTSSLIDAKSISKIKWWHERVAYLVRKITEFEVKYVSLIHENKTLRKIIDESINKPIEPRKENQISRLKTS